MTHIYVSKLSIIGPDNGLSPGQRQSIIWTNAEILLIRPLETNFNEILIEIYTSSFRKTHLKMSSGKWRPFCLGLNVLRVLLTVAWQTLSVYRTQWSLVILGQHYRFVIIDALVSILKLQMLWCHWHQSIYSFRIGPGLYMQHLFHN